VRRKREGMILVSVYMLYLSGLHCLVVYENRRMGVDRERGRVGGWRWVEEEATEGREA
jgi:hypothetical protein